MIFDVECVSHKMLQIIEASSEQADNVEVALLGSVDRRNCDRRCTNGEFTKQPFIDVVVNEGRMEKSPLQVAGALTLPAAVFLSAKA